MRENVTCRRGLVLASLAGLTVLLVACSSGGAPGASGVSPSSSSTKAVELEFTQCMRSHGEPDFPEPNAQGGVTLSGNIDVNSPTYTSAFNYCSKKYGFSGQVSPAQSSVMRADNLRYAACMRANGIRDFPDPNSQGQFSIQATGDLSPTNPRNQAANKICAHLQYQGGGSGPQLGSNGGPGGGSL
jgi:hypothetical protein